MTNEKDAAVRAIDSARALLDTLLSSGLREIHLQSGDCEIFVARKGAGASPMRAAAPVAPAPGAASAATAPQALTVDTEIRLPHVATLVSAAAVGARVVAGQTVATVQVLDEPEDLSAPVGGVIMRVSAQPGDLLDYGTAIVVIAGAA